jgi:hypothetical protein
MAAADDRASSFFLLHARRPREKIEDIVFRYFSAFLPSSSSSSSRRCCGGGEILRPVLPSSFL